MSDKAQVLAQLQALAEEVKTEFRDPRDEARVEQATSALATAGMAVAHLHDARQNRRDLVTAHQAEAAANGRYADERARNPDMYADHYPDPEYDRPESEALA
jgi:hypothetical protein